MRDILDIFRELEKSAPSVPTGPMEWIVAGLGNPGPQYAETRHNMGFLSLNYLAEYYGFRIDRAKYRALCGEWTLDGHRILFMQPQTFMNLSGESIREAANFYRIPPERILVIHDDVSLRPGMMRIRRRGSAGGHNGLKNIIYQLGSEDFPRIKIGVGSPLHEGEMIRWVTGMMPKEDREAASDCMKKIPQAMELILNGQIERAMNLCNAK